MSTPENGPTPDTTRFGPSSLSGPAVLARLDKLQAENDSLGRDLLRCYEQLNLVFEITEHLATLDDPDAIQQILLRRYAAMLNAGALYIERDGVCRAVEPLETGHAPLRLPPELLRATLQEEIETIRQRPHASVPVLGPAVREQLGGAHLLLGAVRRPNSQPSVVIALRAGGEPAFDSNDMLASDSVLGYGGQILTNVAMVRHLQQMAIETVCALANAIDAKDNYTCGHSERVGWLARLTGAALGLPKSDLQVLEWAGLLHDVGKIGISERILNKPGQLTPEEFEEIKKHPRMSYEVLRPVERFGPVLDAVLYHHENHDGSGYPEGLAGDRIPLSARIIHVVDVFDALTTTRPYRRGFTIAQAIETLRAEAGRVTDPHITEVFIKAFFRYQLEQPADCARRFAHNLPQAPGAAATGAGGDR